MSVPTQNNQEQATQDKDKEYNFAQLRKQAEQERLMRQQAEAKAAELERQLQSRQTSPDDDEDDEPYVDKRKLKKELSKTQAAIKQDNQAEIQRGIQEALQQERRNNWLENNPDFQEVMNHAQKFAEKAPKLAESILKMPDTFERQQLVYNNIKEFGLHKKEEPKPSIQETVDRNRRNPGYQPTGVGSAPYASQGDFSASGQKNAYDKMQELKQRLKLG
jgi:hypothetical protein